MQIQLLRNRGGKLGVPLIANLGVFNKRVCVCLGPPPMALQALDSQVQLRGPKPVSRLTAPLGPA